MNFDFDPIQRKIVNGPEAGVNVEVDGFTVNVIGGGTGTETLYNAGTGIGIEGSTITNTMAGSGRIAIDGGTASFIPSADIVNVTGTSVTLQPDTAYKIYATSQAITLNANPPAAGKWAYEGHLEIFVSGTGYVVTGSNVVLANALEPDAVNNCTVRFHDGIAIIAVEDHVAGYIVVNGSTSGDGSLYYGITTSTNDYVAFDASLNGTTIPLAGAVAEGEKHIVGNGYNETTLTGAVDCGTSKFTVANLSLDDVQVTGGVMTFGDAFISSGSTVAVSGGGLAVEKVSVDGELKGGLMWARYSTPKISGSGTLNLDGSYMPTNGDYDFNLDCSGVSIVNGSGGSYGATILARNRNKFNLTSCTIANNTAYWGAARVDSGGTLNLSSCNFSNNAATYRGKDVCLGAATVTITGCTFGSGGGSAETANVAVVANPSSCTVTDCTFGSGVNIGFSTNASSASVTLAGANKFEGIVGTIGTATGKLLISFGAVIDLTGNTNATPIAPGGAITFAPGGATVYPSQGLASAYTLDGIVLPAGANLTNTEKVALHGTHIVLSSGTTAGASGCIISGGHADSGGAFVIPDGAALVLSGCEVTGNVATATSGGGGGIYCNGQLTLSKCYLHNNIASGGSGRGPDLLIQSANARVDACDCRIGRMTTRDNGTVALHGSNSLIILNGGVSGKLIVTPGATLDLTSATESINPGSGVTLSAGSATEKVTVIGSGGQSRTFEDSVISGTSISKIGAIYGATITDVPGPDYYLTYTTDNGATSNTVYLNNTAPTDVSAEYGSSAGALSVFKSNS